MFKIISIFLCLIPMASYAAPPVIWYGNDAKFLNSGSIIVPGLAPGGVCSMDTNGKMTVGTILSSSVTGTANKVAGFNGSGLLEGMSTHTRNTFGGVDISQTVYIPDSGIAESKVFNSKTIDMSPTTPVTNNYYYDGLVQYNLSGTNDFLSFTGNEIFLQQTGANNITSDVTVLKPRIQYGVGGGTNSSQNTKVFDSGIRLSGNHTANDGNAIYGSISMDSGSTASSIETLNLSTYVGGTSGYASGINNNVQVDGSVTGNVSGISQSINSTFPGSIAQNVNQIQSNFTGDVANDYYGIPISYTGDIGNNGTGISMNTQGTVSGSYTEYSAYNNQTISGQFYGISMARDGATTGNSSFINANFSSAATTAGAFSFIGLGNEGTVSDSASGINVYQNGAVSKGWTGLSLNLNADSGDGTSYISGVQVNFQNHDINGGGSGFAFSNTSDVIGNNTLNGITLSNSGAGYSFNGSTVYNNADLTEEFMGVRVNNDSADSRTATGLYINMSGTTTDDAQGITVDVSNQLSNSTTTHVKAFSGNGGLFNQYGGFSPFSSIGVDIGNMFGVTSTVQSGSPLTGTDQIITIVQSNLIAQDTIATGPYGLDTTMFGAVSQVDIGSGITVPLVRAQLLGTTVPSGSGGTIGTFVGLEILGLPSFGGSVTVNNKYGVKDSQLVGQDYCGGVVDCWFLNVRDDAAENYLERLAINTTSEKVRTNVRLDVNDGHIGTDQTTSPVATVDANAGTGAACTISKATDTAFHLEVTTETGAAAGAQCSVAFNQAYVAAPVCTFSPTDANSGANSVQSYQTRTTTNWVINFVVAGGTSVTYGYDVLCLESK